MKKIITVMLIICTVMFLSSCGMTNSSPETERPEPVQTEPEPSAAVETTVQETLPVDENSQDAAVTEVTQENDTTTEFSPEFSFTTTDREGNQYDENVFAGHKLTILNFWEPWCGPCVGEMPELQKLYENYSEKGLQIIGIYSTPGMEDDVDDVLKSAGVTFLILQYTDVFEMFETGYVPTTVFISGEGKVTGEPYIGSRSYSEWESLILEYMS